MKINNDTYTFHILETNQIHDDLIEAITECFNESERTGERYTSIIKHHKDNPDTIVNDVGIVFETDSKKLFTIMFIKEEQELI